MPKGRSSSRPTATRHQKGASDVSGEVKQVLVFHDAGFALASAEELQKAGQITLRSWASVKGTFQVGTRRASGERMTLRFEPMSIRNTQDGYILLKYSATTDSDGNFEFARVPPLEGRLAREIVLQQLDHTSWMTEGPVVPLLVEPGQAVQVQLGGHGTPVVGRFTAPDSADEPIDWSSGSIQLRRAEEPPYPPAVNYVEDRERWLAKWKQTPEGKAFLARAWSSGAGLSNDGSFRIEDVPPGRYAMNAWVFAPKTDKPRSNPVIATAEMEFTVPEPATDKPLDLGKIGIKLVQPPPPAP